MSGFLVVFFLSYYGLVYASNDSLQYYVAKAVEKNLSESTPIAILQNYYNYTVVNQTEQEDGMSGTIMKIEPPEVKQLESTTLSPVTTSARVVENPKWVLYTLREGLNNFRVRSDTNPKCQSHSDLYEMHLKNQTLWAIKSKF